MVFRARSAPLVAALALSTSCAAWAPPGSPDVSESPVGAFEAGLAPLGDGFAAAWYDTRDGHPEIYARMLDRSGRPSGSPFRLTRGADAAYEASITPSGGNLVVGWYEKTASGALTPKLGAWTPDGTARWTRPLAASGRNTVVAARDGAIAAAWIVDDTEEASSVWLAWLTAEGETRMPPVRLASAGRTTWNLNATIDDAGEVWVVFDARAGTRAEELFLVRASQGAASPPVRLTRDDGVASKYPDVAIAHGRAGITWFDERDGNQEVYLATVRVAAIPDDLAAAAQRVTQTAGHSIGAYLDWNGERLGVAWCDDTGGQHEIYFQDFSDTGVPFGPPRQVTRTPWSSLIPAIQPAGAGFLLAWNEANLAAAARGHDRAMRSRVVTALIP